MPMMYEWPESQKCMECQYGKFIMSDELTNSNYLCMAGCADNDGVDCPAFIEEMGENEKGNLCSC